MEPGDEDDDEDKADAKALVNQIKNLTGLWDSDPEEVIPLPLVVVRRFDPSLSYEYNLKLNINTVYGIALWYMLYLYSSVGRGRAGAPRRVRLREPRCCY